MKKRIWIFPILLLLYFFSIFPALASNTNPFSLYPTARTDSEPSWDKVVSFDGHLEDDLSNGKEKQMAGAWLLCNGQLRYQYIDGSYLYNTWATIDKKNYHFDENGNRQVGWIQSENAWYYLNEDGIMQTGWISLEDGVYYCDGKGVRVSGWLEDNGNKYYLDENGLRQNGWVTVNDTQYFFNPDGILTTGWVTDENGTYYLNSDSKKTSGWLELDNKKYYFSGDGRLQTGWQVIGKQAYFFNTANGELTSLTNSANGKKIALTFDDGPGPYTDRLLSILSSNNAKATFFVLGENISAYPEVIRKMEANGNLIGNHSYNHARLTGLDAAGISAQINDTNAALTAVLGHATGILRPPYGSYNDFVLQNSGMASILWSIDTLDWKTKNAAASVLTVLNSVQNGDIILFHDIHSPSVDAIEILLPTLKDMGYEMVTVADLATSKGISLEVGKSYSAFH